MLRHRRIVCLKRKFAAIPGFRGKTMKRRDFAATLGALTTAWTVAARAPETRLYRVGALLVGNENTASFRAVLAQIQVC